MTSPGQSERNNIRIYSQENYFFNECHCIKKLMYHTKTLLPVVYLMYMYGYTYK
jgi:hypothetical protein